MGRLYKAKVNSIQGLLKQGYLQKEVAEKLGVSVRTVRKYDPSSRSRTSLGSCTAGIPELVRNVIVWMLDYMQFLEDTLELDKIRNGRCPRCGEKQFEFDAIKFVYRCGNCGYSMALPSYICRNCFAQNNFDQEDPYKCRECGHKIY